VLPLREGRLLIVCSCHGITDRDIRRLVREGATSPRQVAEACGAGMGCGGCRPCVRALVAEAAAPSEKAPLLALARSPEPA